MSKGLILKPTDNIIDQLSEKYELNQYEKKLLPILILPKALRPHYKQIHGQLGISERYYFALLHSPKLNNARQELIKQYYMDDLSDVLQAMKYEAISGNERAARLFLEYVADFKKEEDNKKPIDNAVRIPPAENVIIINELTQKFYGNRPREDQPIEGIAEPIV